MRLLVLAALAAALVLAQPLPKTPPSTAVPAAAPAPAPAAVPAPAAAPAPPAAPAVADWIAKFDELWKKRDQAAAIKDLHTILEQQLAKDPHSFEANWRLASVYNWEANGTEGDKKAELGKLAWEVGDKAILAKPEDVRGHYQAGVGVGLYSEGIGILTALAQGIEGKFRDRMHAALRIDKDYLDGAPQVVWGRYFFKLPWPKRDVDQSIKVLEECLATHQDNWRGKIYLADSLADQGKTEEARRFAQDVLDGRNGTDPPEDRRLKEMARKWMASH
jgi:tetratricopeptide (TPR) repeat protein